MTFLEQWHALGSRIRGVVRAGQLHAQFLAVKNTDSYGRAKQLRDHCLSILVSLEQFGDSFSASLPPPAVDAINRCLSKEADISVAKLLGIEASDAGGTREEKVSAALVMLAAFETEITFLLSDVQAAIRARTERAFQHLQRLIVVDLATREQWKGALKEGELTCEKRGAVHLLLHGIWAFKVGAAGERTDLVYQQPAGGLLDEGRYAEGLVLTEWKTASSDADAQKQFMIARDQAKRYAQGVLAGSELTAFRYLVAVSSKHITVPADVHDGSVIYRHINLAVDPEPPSRARQQRRPAA